MMLHVKGRTVDSYGLMGRITCLDSGKRRDGSLTQNSSRLLRYYDMEDERSAPLDLLENLLLEDLLRQTTTLQPYQCKG